MHALLCLLAALLALAAAFFALGASFAAVLQILIYAGAIVVVFVFAVMTVDPALARGRAALAEGWHAPAAISALVAAPFLFGLGAVPPGAPAPVSAQAVGSLLFGPWALVVELASFLLLAGLIGVRHLGRRDRGRGRRS